MEKILKIGCVSEYEVLGMMGQYEWKKEMKSEYYINKILQNYRFF